MGIDYDNITDDQIEELAEFIDWSMISQKLVSTEIRKRFSCFPDARLKFWFDDLFSDTVSNLDKMNFPKSIYFMYDEKVFLELDLESLNIWISVDRICFLVNSSYKKSNFNMVSFIENIVNKHFRNLLIFPKNQDIWLEINCSKNADLSLMEVISRKTSRRDDYVNQLKTFTI